MWNDPSWANLGFLLWDVGATVLPFVPGSYTAKGGKLLIKAASKWDDVVDGFRALSKVDRLAAVGDGMLVAPYKYLKKIAKGLGQEVHHLVEKRFAKTLGVNADEILSIALDSQTHKKITARMRELIPYDLPWWAKADDVIRTSSAKADDIWKALKTTYTELGMTEYLDEIADVFRSQGVKIP